eukprot:1145668-Pelagomonas_calceolata.AAC.5
MNHLDAPHLCHERAAYCGAPHVQYSPLPHMGRPQCNAHLSDSPLPRMGSPHATLTFAIFVLPATQCSPLPRMGCLSWSCPQCNAPQQDAHLSGW